MKGLLFDDSQYDFLISEIRKVIRESRKEVTKTINTKLLETYWKIGKIIIENENKNAITPKSSRQIILMLSKFLTKELGKGFSRANLFNMRKFFIEFPDVQTVSGQLSWSHYCELLTISDKQKRNFYTVESIDEKWSVRELRRQINSALYERLLLSKGKINKKTVLSLAEKGQEVSKPEDIIKSPYVFEFLGIPENKQISDAGQLNTYLNYFKTEINDKEDNPPIGIILCAEKEEIAAEYILSGIENNVFASKFTYILPNKEELINELEKVMSNK